MKKRLQFLRKFQKEELKKKIPVPISVFNIYPEISENLSI